jgi:hypothetical protein
MSNTANDPTCPGQTVRLRWTAQDAALRMLRRAGGGPASNRPATRDELTEELHNAVTLLHLRMQDLLHVADSLGLDAHDLAGMTARWSQEAAALAAGNVVRP